MKKIIAGTLGAVVLTFGLASPALANTSAKVSVTADESVVVRSGYAKLIGTVTAVSTSSLSVSSDSAPWTVNVDGDAKVIAKGVGAIALSDVKVGHKVWAIGKVEGSSTLDAAVVRDLSLSVKRTSLRGIISELSAELKSFTLTLKNGETVKVTADADTKIVVKNSTSTATSTSIFADLANGMTVKVKGLLSKNGTSTPAIKASSIVGINATTTATSSVISDWEERWENWKERWQERHERDEDHKGESFDNENRKDDEAHLRILEKVDTRIDAGIQLGR